MDFVEKYIEVMISPMLKSCTSKPRKGSIDNAVGMLNAVNIKGEQTEHALVKAPANMPKNPTFDFAVISAFFPNCNVIATAERIVNAIRKTRFSKLAVSVNNNSPCNSPGMLMKFIRSAAATPIPKIDKMKTFLLRFSEIVLNKSFIIQPPLFQLPLP